MTINEATPGRPVSFIEFIAFLTRQVRLRWLFVPPMLLALELAFVYYIIDNEMRSVLENAAIIVLWCAMAIMLFRAILQRKAFFVWLSVFMGALLFREYHLIKISTGITYVVLFDLLIAAWLNCELFLPYLRNSANITLIAMMGLTYVLSQTLDFDFFKYGHWVF